MREKRSRGGRERERARALSLSLSFGLIVSLSSLPGQPGAFPHSPLSRAICDALRAPNPPPTNAERKSTISPGIDALQSSALTSALPRAESSDARDDRGEESGDDATDVTLFAPPAPPPNTLADDSALSSERRPSTRPSDVAGEGKAFSVASGKGEKKRARG
jgi:hypothetical protein